MAEEEPTTGDEIKARIGTGASGVAVGREIQQTSVNDSHDDRREDSHDDKRNENRTSVNVSLENNDRLQAIQRQLDRLEGNVTSLGNMHTDFAWMKRDIEQIKFSGWEQKNQIQQASGKVDGLAVKVDALESKINNKASGPPPIPLSTIILIMVGILGFAIALIFAGVYLGRLV